MTRDVLSTPSEPERLQRYLARAGVASRRAAEILIAEGRVTVNGVTVIEPGTKVTAGIDQVGLDGAAVGPRAVPHAYYALNKPAGVVTTLRDPQGRPTIADLLPRDGRRLFAVGRLDADTTGLLLLTDDGDLAHRLMHPRYHVAKTYRAVVAGSFTEEAARRLREGIELDDGATAPADVTLVRSSPGESEVLISVREGRKRQVRRMFGAVGHRVRTLSREAFGPVVLGGLAPGAVRPLSENEIGALRLASGLEGDG